MPKILLIQPTGFKIQAFSSLENDGHLIETNLYQYRPAIPTSPSFDLIIIVLENEAVWLKTVLSTFRKHDTYTPVLVSRDNSLNSLDEEILINGCDAIIEIPCTETYLLHRVSSLISRTFLNKHKQYILDSDTVLDSQSHCLIQNGRKNHLGSQQFKILEFLVSHAGSYFTTFQLLERNGMPSDSAAQSSLRMQIMKIRKLLNRPGCKNKIVTKYGHGYSIEAVEIEESG